MEKKRKNTSNKIGDKFEQRVQRVCDELRKNKICMLSKVPTEWKVIRNGGKIVSGFPVSESKFVDYVGVYKGKSVSIETKTCANKTSFPLSNIKDTQFEYFLDYELMGGLGYYIIEFREHKEIYLVKSMQIETFRNSNERKSIPYQWFKDNGVLLDYERINFIDYIMS